MTKTSAGRRAALPSASLRVGRRQHFRIADIGPVAGELDDFNLGAGVGESADGVGELVLATRRFFEARGVLENARTEEVDPSIVPRAGWFAWLGLFAQIGHAPLVVDEHGAALGNLAGI